MGVYSDYKCPTCGKTAEHLVPMGAKGVGEPLRRCENCNNYINFSKLFNEWELMSPSEKKGMQFRVVAEALQTALLTGVAAFIVLGFIISGDFSGKVPHVIVTFVTFFIIGFIFSYLNTKKELRQEIENSKQRMKKPEYRDLLLRLKSKK